MDARPRLPFDELDLETVKPSRGSKPDGQDDLLKTFDDNAAAAQAL